MGGRPPCPLLSIVGPSGGSQTDYASHRSAHLLFPFIAGGLSTVGEWDGYQRAAQLAEAKLRVFEAAERSDMSGSQHSQFVLIILQRARITYAHWPSSRHSQAINRLCPVGRPSRCIETNRQAHRRSHQHGRRYALASRAYSMRGGCSHGQSPELAT